MTGERRIRAARHIGHIEFQSLLVAQALDAAAGRNRQGAARRIFAHRSQTLQVEGLLPVALHGEAKKPIQKHGLPAQHSHLSPHDEPGKNYALATEQSAKRVSESQIYLGIPST